MKKLRVMVLMHKELLPPDTLEGKTRKEIDLWRTEYDVVSTLRDAGREVFQLGVGDEIQSIRNGVDDFQPDIIFNLLEAFNGECTYDQNVVAYLELLRQRYTGCNPRGLTLARDKALSKKILSYHRIRTPAFKVFPMARKIKRPKWLGFPLIVKSLVEEASYGISQASVVDSDEKLFERVEFIHERVGTDAIVEEYIQGRELYVGVAGTARLQVFPVWELFLDRLPKDAAKIATEKVKWDPEYQKRHGIVWRQAELTKEQEDKIRRTSKRIYRRLGLSGYARLDYRMNEAGEVYLLEANPNPNIAKNDEFATSAMALGMDYPKLLEKVIRIGLKRPV